MKATIIRLDAPWLRLRYIRIGRLSINWHPALWRRCYLYRKVARFWALAIGPLRIEVRKPT